MSSTQNSYTVELVYRIKLLRIVFGFSADELSFLLGYPYNEVKAIERFTCGRTYSLQDLIHLSFIFECPSIRFLPTNKVDSTFLKLKTFEYEFEGRIFQEAWELRDGNHEELLWKLPEQNLDQSGIPKQVENLIKTAALIRQLLSEGYFEMPWETFEVFKVCRETLGNQLRPAQLREVLLSFTTERAGRYLRIQPKGKYITWVASES